MNPHAGATHALDLALALLDNGDALLDDAVALLEAGRPTRAIALALIAAEELAKTYLCLGSITGDDEFPDGASREWRDHRSKLETARALELVLIDEHPELDRDTIKTEVHRQLRTKMSALYVDHAEGITRRPDDLDVDPENLIVRGRAKSNFLRGIFSLITPEVLPAIREGAEPMSRAIEELIDEEDPHGTFGRLRAVAAAATQTMTAEGQVSLTNDPAVS